MREPLFGGEQLLAVFASVGGKVGEAGFHAVDAGLNHAGRVGDAFGLTVDHADDLADFADGVTDRTEARLGGAAALDAGLDLGRHRSGFAGQLADGRGDLAGRRTGVVGELLHLGGNDGEAAAGITGARGLDRRI